MIDVDSQSLEMHEPVMNRERDRVFARGGIHLALGIGDVQINRHTLDAEFLGNRLTSHTECEVLQAFKLARRQAGLLSRPHYPVPASLEIT